MQTANVSVSIKASDAVAILQIIFATSIRE